MKKLLITMVSVAALAFTAKAATDGTISGTDFSAYADDYTGQFNISLPDDREGSTTSLWTVEGLEAEQTAEVGNITNSTDLGTYDVQGSLTLGVKSLAVDTEKRLSRNIEVDAKEAKAVEKNIGEGLFFDSLVQFTATDTAPEVTTGDKLIVWLYGSDEKQAQEANESEGTEAQPGSLFGQTTNLVVTAGVLNQDDYTYDHSFNFKVTNVTIEPNTWHRLTIKTYSDEVLGAEGVPVTRFVVLIDGVEVSALDEAGQATSMFASMLDRSDAKAATLTSVSFEGTGAIDQLWFKSEDPFPEGTTPGGETFSVDVTKTDSYNAIVSVACAIDGKVASLVDGKLNVTKEQNVITITIDAYTEDESGLYDFTIDGAEKSGDPKGNDTDGYVQTWTMTVNVAGLKQDNTDKIAITVVATEKSGSGETEGPAFDLSNGDSDYESVDAMVATANSGKDILITGGSATDSMIDNINHKITVGGTEVKIAAYYDAAVNDSKNGFKLTLNDNAKPVIGEADLNADETAEPAISFDAEGKFTITVKGGQGAIYSALYYKLMSDDAPNGTFTTLEAYETGKDAAFQLKTKAAASAAKKFYKIVVDDIAPSAE